MEIFTSSRRPWCAATTDARTAFSSASREGGFARSGAPHLHRTTSATEREVTRAPRRGRLAACLRRCSQVFPDRCPARLVEPSEELGERHEFDTAAWHGSREPERVRETGVFEPGMNGSLVGWDRNDV